MEICKEYEHLPNKMKINVLMNIKSHIQTTNCSFSLIKLPKFVILFIKRVLNCILYVMFYSRDWVFSDMKH